MRFGVLGTLEVTDSRGRLVDLGPPKQRAVLAVLLLAANRVVAIDRLVEELWGDEAPPRAMASLQAYISNLRRALEPDRAPRAPATVLLTQPPGYVLRVAPGEFDAEEFTTLAAAGRGEFAAGRYADAVDTWTRALKLWRGEALAEFAGEPFAEGEIARLDALRLAVVEDRLDARLRLGDHEPVVPDAHDLVVAAPLRERSWQLLMLALYRCRRQAEALEAYQRARRLLVDELGIEPSAELRDLEAAILRQDPSLDLPARPVPVVADAAPALSPATSPAGSPAPPEPEPKASVPFVGRAKLIDEIAACAARARGGEGGVVLVAGEAGIGKSRLVEEVARVAGEHADVLVGRCHDGEGTPAFWPWRQALRTLSDGRGHDTIRAAAGVGADDVDRLLPTCVAQTGIDVSENEAPAALFRLFDSVTTTLGRLAADRPIVFVLEDLHWADASSLRLLRFLSREIRSMPVFVLATFRPAAASPAAYDELAAVTANAGARYDLAGWSAAEIADYLAATTGRGDYAAATVLHERTGGNPFYLTELVRLVRSEHREVDAMTAAFTDVPASVRDVIRRRLSRLPDDAQSLLRLAAVAGDGFTVDLLATASGLDEDRVLELLEIALLSGTVVESGEGVGHYRFGHALVRQAIYDGLLAVRAARLHARLADALVALNPTTPDDVVEKLAFHYCVAAPVGYARQGREYAVAAAAQATRRRAYVEAAGYWRAALDALDHEDSPPPGARIDLLVGRAVAERRCGDLPGARASLRDALTLALDAGDAERVAAVAAGFAGATWTWQNHDVVDTEAIALLERALGSLGPGQETMRARVLGTLATELYYADNPERADRLTAEAVRLARESGGPHDVALALVHRFTALWWPEHLAARLEATAEAVGLPGVPPELAGVVRLLHLVALTERGDIAAAESLLAECRDHVQRLGQPFLRSQLEWYEGSRLLLLGRFDEVEEHIERAYELHDSTNVFGAREARLAQLFQLRRAQGRLAELLPALREFAGHDRIGGFPDMLALALLRTGQPDEAHAVIERHRARPVPHSWATTALACLRADLASTVGDAAMAAGLLDVLRPYAGMFVNAGVGTILSGPVDYYIGRCLVTVGDLPAAALAFESALEADRRTGLVVPAMRASLDLAGVLSGLGDDTRALALRESAAAEASRLDLLPASAAGVRRD